MTQLIEDSVSYVQKTLKPATKNTRKTVGNMPEELHSELLAFAEENNIKMFQVVGALWDFYCLYEETHEKELKEKRANMR